MRACAPSSLVLPILLLFILLPGCGDDAVGPVEEPTEAVVRFDGNWSPGNFVLQRVEHPVPGGVIRVDLVATNLRVDESEDLISLDVAVRNRSGQTLFGPLLVFVGDFAPDTVRIVNGDEQLIDVRPGFEFPLPHLFDYTTQMGEDQLLADDETTRPRTWQFSDPDLLPFAFATELRARFEPPGGALGGRVFLDLDRDGVLDPDEPPFAGSVTVRGPGDPNVVARTRVEEDGSWRVRSGAPGLYIVHYELPPLGSPLPRCLTTANPLQILLPPDPMGRAQSYLDANFGVDPEPCFPPLPPTPPVKLFSGPADSIRTDPFRLLSAAITHADPVDPSLPPTELLELRIGFSGCSPDHPVRVFAGADFAESEPVRTWLRVQHDDRGELCDAAFERGYAFDLAPLRERYRELYGRPGTIVLELTLPDGSVRELILP